MSTIFDPPEYEPFSEIHEAAKSSNLAKVKELVQRNPELVFSRDKDGRTPLHYAACDRQSRSLVEFLIAKKAEVNAKCNRGYTPLHLAAANGARTVTELLLANHAEITAKAHNGDTPLSEAEAMKNSEVAELLRRHISTGTNLDRWKLTAYPETWVKKHIDGWNHDDWLGLLTSLRKSQYWPMNELAIGQHIEMLRSKLQTDTAPKMAR
jgi:ankyrin repeat protein